MALQYKFTLIKSWTFCNILAANLQLRLIPCIWVLSFISGFCGTLSGSIVVPIYDGFTIQSGTKRDVVVATGYTFSYTPNFNLKNVFISVMNKNKVLY